MTTVDEVLALLPQDGSEMNYADLEVQAVNAPIDNPREALRTILKQGLITKRLVSLPDPNRPGKEKAVLMVKKL